MDPETIHPEEVIHLNETVVEILKLVGDPFLIVALIVIFLMYRVLQRKEKTFDSSLRDVFNELHANALLLTEQAAVIKTLVDILKAKHDREEKKESRKN